MGATVVCMLDIDLGLNFGSH